MTAFSLTATVDQKSAAQLRQALNQFPLAVQDAVVRKAMRPFLTEEMRMIRAKNAGKLPPNHLKAKVKVFRSGVAWGACAYKTGRANVGDAGGRLKRLAYDAAGVGWRSHFTELGTHAWSSALRTPPSARGKGWKRKLYHRGRGTYLRGTHASELTHSAMAGKFQQYLIDALNLEIERRNYSLGNARPKMKLVQEF